MNLYLGLVHHPIVNKRGETITTSVTNLDIHDISRSCRTYGFEGYFIISPIEAQQELLGRILGHWEKDVSSAYNPDRHDALSKTYGVKSLEEMLERIEEREGEKPLITVTGANFQTYDGETQQLAERLQTAGRPLALLFGTGWGLAQEVVQKADFRLKPILGAARDNYNHLSVRSAVAIYLDRLANVLKKV